MKLEFLMCGNHTDAFLSQAAMYRMMLDSHGGDHARARLVLCVGGPSREALPARFRRAFENIDLIWAGLEEYAERGDYAQSDLIYRVLDETADLSVICDADTMLVRPLPEDYLKEMQRGPALTGCIAHYQPPLKDFRVPPPPAIASVEALWQILGERLLGHGIETPYRYTLKKKPEDVPGLCPFYINLGFFAGPPKMLKAFHAEHQKIVPVVRGILDNMFYEQLSVPYAAARAELATRALPMRFNFPNDPIADRMHPDELRQAVNVHYLRTTLFDRHRIFATAEDFAAFLALHLEGSNKVFRDAIAHVTGSHYPFGA
ncbi:hypothetical protein [Aestuariivirga sp.]|uniref:hypothetical protein n=1 Tax=Aestuariivirga sp. TaxID=2650926 RepID=UPI0039E44548